MSLQDLITPLPSNFNFITSAGIGYQGNIFLIIIVAEKSLLGKSDCHIACSFGIDNLCIIGIMYPYESRTYHS